MRREQPDLDLEPLGEQPIQPCPLHHRPLRVHLSFETHPGVNLIGDRVVRWTTHEHRWSRIGHAVLEMQGVGELTEEGFAVRHNANTLKRATVSQFRDDRRINVDADCFDRCRQHVAGRDGMQR